MSNISSFRSKLRDWIPPALVSILRKTKNIKNYSEFNLPAIQIQDIASGYSTEKVEIQSDQIFRTKSMVLPLEDLLCIATIAKSRRAMDIFEIGTYTGSTTLLFAMNTEKDANITTLDLDPNDMPTSLLDQNGKPVYDAGIIFRQTSYANKIKQVYGKSEEFDFSEYFGKIDLVYIDADHRYEAVLRDSETALKLLKPGGLIVWDDYRWLPEHAECIGVTKALNELSKRIPIYQLQGTRLAVSDLKVHKN